MLDMNEILDYKKLLKRRDVKLLFYISRILFRNSLFYMYPVYMFLQFCKILNQKKKYSLQLINDDVIYRVVEESDRHQIDENYTVIINNPFLAGKANAVLKVEHEGKIIQVYVKPLCWESVDKNVIFVSKTLLFNISNNIDLTSYQSTEHSLTGTIRGISTGKIGIAKEIHLAVINSPFELDNIVLDSLVKNYFRKPKLICENSVIEINMKIYLMDIPSSMTKVFNTKDKVYFKCTKILGNIESNSRISGKYAVLGETTFKQVANIQSFLPPCIEMKPILIDVEKNHIQSPTCPRGLEHYLYEFEAAVKPFLTKKLAMNPAFLITGKKGSGKEIIISSLAAKFGIHFYKIINFDVTAHVYAQNEAKLKNVFFNAKLYAPCILYMKNFENYEKNNEGVTDERIISHFTSGLKNLFTNNKFPVILFCSSNDDKISARLKREFLEIFKINPPTKEERTKIIEWLFQYHNVTYQEDLTEVVQKTNTFLFEDLNILVKLAKSQQTYSKKINTLTSENLSSALDYMHLYHNQNIGAPKVPKVQWDDIGGLRDVKEDIIKTINFPLKHPEFVNSTGLRRFGILLFGPPGTGKTLLAKAVATECNLCFLSVKGPELLNMYIGQSEENIREVFERARAASPCIIFFDELDSLAPNRGVSGDSGGVMDRVVSQLLAEMDGLNEKATVFIIGATNRPDLIDPALLRPGRFDKLLYVGPAMDFTSRLSVLKALTRKFNLNDKVRLEDIVKLCPSNISGADFYGICAESWMHAVRRTIQQCENGPIDVKNFTEKDVEVGTDDFIYALRSVKPSITSKDLMYFEKLKREISSNE